MKIITTMGCVYKMSDRAYQKILHALANDLDFDIDKLGTMLADQHVDITDMGAEEAQDKLDDLRADRKAARASKSRTERVS
jgi:hypothetical protein